MSEIGFLFDLDGTLINSLESVDRAWVATAKEAGVPLEELGRFHGIPALQVWRELLVGGTEEDAQYYTERVLGREIMDTESVVANPGAHELLAELDERKIPWTIVTSGVKPLAIARTKAAGIRFPENSVTFDQVKQGKPFPEPYILGAQRIALPTSMTWGVEDAPGGIRAAKDAGCTVASIATTHKKDELFEADYHLESLADLLKLAGLN